MPYRPPDIAEILSEAVELETAAARDAFLDRACAGDNDLRDRAAELVRMHFLAGDFLEHPATEFAETLLGPHAPIRPGSQIGPYKLLQEIGEGGMGVVYMAQQERPVQRRVALKVIKPGMDTRQVIARFEAERQALAMMDHPNIAKVFDAGMTEGGRPYFVMELINGVPITRYCDEHHLTPIERLRLFLPVCHAVQHAHQKGIIHRDLKPSNVLVAHYDDLAIPKVIDFGVAKATNQQLTDLTLFTEFGQVMGTFEYMSPEQARRNQLDVDTRTDVYSLGVILYELLTGGTPFDAARFRQAAIDEILRIIGDEEPPRPSLKLSGSQSLPSIAANRRLEPGRLSRFVAGDLDWIVMRTLEKDRGRRYATVGSLAADVQRFLNDEPVEAGPPSALYRFRKFAHRNTGLIVSASLIATLLFVGTIVSSWLAIRAMRAERNLAKLAALAQERAEDASDARDEAIAGRRIAVEREIQARKSQFAANLLTARDAYERADPVAALERLAIEVPRPGELDARSFGWYYLRAQLGRELAVFEGHTGFVLAATYSPDGRTLATAGADHSVQLWNVPDRTRKLSLSGHDGEVNSVAFSPDGMSLASAGDDSTVRIWNAGTGESRAVLGGHEGHVRTAVYSPDGAILATAGTDGTIKLWNVAGFTEIGVLTGHTREINQVAFSPDGAQLASCADDQSVRLWDLESRSEKALFAGHVGHVRSVAFTPDGAFVLSGGRDAAVKVWSTETLAEVADLKGHTAGVAAIALSPDGALLASVGEDRTLRFWDMDRRQFLSSRVGHEARVYAVAFAPDGKTVATGGGDRTARIWEIPGADERIMPGRTVPAKVVAFSPGNRFLAACGWGTDIRLWNLKAGQAMPPLGRHSFSVSAIGFMPDCQTLVSAGDAGSICWWDIPTGEVRAEFAAHNGPIRQIAFSEELRLMATCSDDLTIRLWRLADNTPEGTLAGFDATVESIAFVPRTRLLVSGSRDGTVRIWDLSRRSTVGLLDGNSGVICTVAASPDGRVVAAGCQDGAIRLWDIASERLVMTLRGHSMQVESVAFSPDGTFLASGSNDQTVRLWDLATELSIATFAGHTGHVNSVAISDDGRWLASAGSDSAVRLWEIRTAPGWENAPRSFFDMRDSNDRSR